MIEIILTIIKKYWKIVLIVILSIICFFAISDAIKQRKVAKTYKDNVQILGSLNDTLRDKNGILQTEQNVLQLKLSEAKELAEHGNKTIDKLLKELTNSKIREKEAIQLTNLTIEGIYKFRPDLIDSLMIIENITIYDTVIDSIRVPVEKFNNEWISYIRIIKNDHPEVSIKVKNDIVLYKSWYKEGFILFRWLKKRQYKYTVKDLNPYSNIKSFNVIDLGKEK